MYEQTEQPTGRRVLWIVLWFIIIAAVAWVFIWLIFFRGDNTETNTDKLTSSAKNQSNGSSQKSKTSNTSDSSKSSSDSSKNNHDTNGGSADSSDAASSGSSQAAAGTAQTTPSQLANTGAGDVMLPVVAASVAGSALYYIRIRKKLTA